MKSVDRGKQPKDSGEFQPNKTPTHSDSQEIKKKSTGQAQKAKKMKKLKKSQGWRDCGLETGARGRLARDRQMQQAPSGAIVGLKTAPVEFFNKN